MPKRRIPSVFLFKFIIFKLFIGIFCLKMYKFFICFFIRILYTVLNHFPAQVLPYKKNGALCMFCVRRYSAYNLLSFYAKALYFVRPLYLVPLILIHVSILIQYVHSLKFSSSFINSFSYPPLQSSPYSLMQALSFSIL
jgi:hypothetical protein